MSMTGRIRTWLVLIALVPPLLVMAVIYLHSSGQNASTNQQAASEAISRYSRFNSRFQDEPRRKVREMAAGRNVQQAVLLIQSNHSGRIDLTSDLAGVDFLEIVDSSLSVRASGHRPGLIGESLRSVDQPASLDTLSIMETVEYDVNGPHAAFSCAVPLPNRMYLYAGEYISDDLRGLMAELLSADVHLYFPLEDDIIYSGMDRGQLYRRGDSLVAILAGGREQGFFLAASFPENSDRPAFASLLRVTGLVALATTLIAMILGFYVTSRAKREIDNLVVATARVARGDFSTPVMAYEEGEFSQLADAFSDMMLKLKALQGRLGTAEKIAAWQAMGRKMAHEIKNPLTPISISIDDLRRSYDDNLPEFDKTLKETTATIKSEITRLTRLLDQFSGFARMSPPEIHTVRLDAVIEPIKTLYRNQLESGQLELLNNSARKTVPVDEDQIRQVLINIIKNGLECRDGARVTVTFADSDDNLVITVEDDGPGFSDEILTNSFQPHLSKKKGGSGLGLVICQRIVFDHGGSVELYNRTEEGAGVRIVLPLNHG